jgi:hypothetical protein
VAHIIQIPVSVEFRTTKIQWEEVRANITGWRNQQGEAPAQLIAGIRTISGKKKTIAFPLSKLPYKERKQCLGALEEGHSEGAVTDICSGLDLRFFVHDRKTYIEDLDLREHSQAADAWQLRDDFLNLKPNGETVLAFLGKWGRWKSHRNYVDLAEIIAFQQAVRQALTSPAEIWFRSLYASPPVVNSRSSKFPYFVILTDACTAAMSIATTMDLLRHLKFKICARSDCANTFQVTSSHRRDYCTQYCAHLESMRRSRKSRRSE